MMISERRVSLPPRPNDKQSCTPINRSYSKKSLRSQLKTDADRTCHDIMFVQVENFVDESLLTHLPVSREVIDIPVLEEMPSVDLESVPWMIQTPRDFDEFRREVLLFQDKLDKYYQTRKYIRAEPASRPSPPKIDWNYQKSLSRSQVIRQNCSNIEYQKILIASGRRKISGFTDDVFPPNHVAFYCRNNRSGSPDKTTKPHTWRRLCYNKTESFSYSRLQQGIYKTQNMLSGFLALPIFYQMNLFEGQNFDGKSIFYVKLNKQGTWRYIMIDNLIPYGKDGQSFLSQSFPLTLLEKAWAKYLGSYNRLDSIQDQPLGQIMTDLTGAPSEQISCSHPRFLLTLKLMFSKKYILLASNQHNESKRTRVEYELGIPEKYAYPIEQIDGEYIILRNVWGCESTSPFFGTEQVRLHINEFKMFFDSVVINKILPQGHNHYNNITVRQRKGFYSLIQLSVSQSTSAFLMLSQIDKLNNLEEYSQCKLILFETCSGSVWYLRQTESSRKNTTLETVLAPGQYLVLVQMTWIAKEYETTLCVLSTRPVTLTKLKFSQHNDYLLSLKKQKTQSERRATSTSLSKFSRSEEFRAQK